MLELIFVAQRNEAESLSDVLFEAGALSVTVEDRDANAPDEQALYGEPGEEPALAAWHSNSLIVLATDETHAAQLCAAAYKAGFTQIAQTRNVVETDWVRATQSQFTPIAIGKRLWIAPSWHHSTQAPADAITIELDPGMAFGTGSHPTTHLCLEWLEHYVNAHDTVLDYGCGSGILAIAAKKLGAQRVVGVDIDHHAVQASLTNAQTNHCEIAAYLPHPTEQWKRQQYSIVIANILSNPLKVLAPLLAACVCHDSTNSGKLVLSGVLARQAEEVIAAYAPFHALQVWREKDGWVCLASCL